MCEAGGETAQACLCFVFPNFFLLFFFLFVFFLVPSPFTASKSKVMQNLLISRCLPAFLSRLSPGSCRKFDPLPGAPRGVGVSLAEREPLQSGTSNNLKRASLAICLSLGKKGDDSLCMQARSLVSGWRRLLWGSVQGSASGPPEPPAFGAAGLGCVAVAHGVSCSNARCDLGVAALSDLVSSGPVF